MPSLRLALLLLISLPLSAADDGRVRTTVLHLGRPIIAVSAPAADVVDTRSVPALAAKVSCDFQDADIDEVTGFFRRMTDVNIVIAPEARMNATPVTLEVSDMTAATALRWAVRQAGLHMGHLHEAVYLDVRPVRGGRSTHLYDVTDLVSPVQDFPGPELAFNAGDGGGQGDFDIFDNDRAAFGEEHDETMTAEDLAELIEEHFE